MENKIKNKRGAIGILLFGLFLFLVLLIGFFSVIVSSVFDIVSDEVTPIMQDLGVVENANVSQYASYGFGTLNTIIQGVPWMIAFAYVMALLFTIVFIFLSGYSPHPAFIGFYLALMILIIFGSTYVSNMYEDIYGGTDDLALRLQEQNAMSFMILHSPFILALIMIIGGIMMFTRQNLNEGGSYGV